MRTAVLASALMLVATVAWADEPSDLAAKAEATAQTTPAKPAVDAASEATTASTAAADDKRPIKPPAGYRPKRVNGERVWCAKIVVLGSRFPEEDCRNEAQLRELIRIRESMRTDLETRTRMCNGGCASR